MSHDDMNFWERRAARRNPPVQYQQQNPPPAPVVVQKSTPVWVWLLFAAVGFALLTGLGGAGAGLALLEEGGGTVDQRAGGGFASPSYEVNPVIENNNYNYNYAYAQTEQQQSQQAAGEEISRSSSSGRVDWSQGIQGPQPAEPAAGFDWSVGGAANLRSDLFGN